jgi:hypothetical protein
MKLLPIALSCAWFFLSGCATLATAPAPGTPQGPGPAVAAPDLGLFSKVRAPAGVNPVLRLSGRGAQVFRCERREGALVWVFRQPDAELLDAAGQPVGRHGSNFSFEHSDGSRLISTITAHDEATSRGDLRWLLFTTRPYGKGAFEGVTHVQRVNTRGGVPPARCETADLNKVLRVDFTSDFVFYRPRSE